MSESDDPHPLAKRIANSIEEQIGEDSRRSFLTRSALAGGTLLALGGGVGATLADETDEHDDMTASFDDVEGTDVDVLNYALTLEHLENSFYREALEMFDEDDFTDAEVLQSMNRRSRRQVFNYVQTVGEHEQSHVEVITQAVELLGGVPAQEATYDFGIQNVRGFLELGQVLENTGVAAYAGAARFIESPDLLGAALSIHSVEARHAAIFNRINGNSPFPNAFDPPSSQQEVLDAVGPLVVSDVDVGDNQTTTTTTTDTNDTTTTTTTHDDGDS